MSHLLTTFVAKHSHKSRDIAMSMRKHERLEQQEKLTTDIRGVTFYIEIHPENLKKKPLLSQVCGLGGKEKGQLFAEGESQVPSLQLQRHSMSQWSEVQGEFCREYIPFWMKCSNNIENLYHYYYLRKYFQLLNENQQQRLLAFHFFQYLSWAGMPSIPVAHSSDCANIVHHGCSHRPFQYISLLFEVKKTSKHLNLQGDRSPNFFLGFVLFSILYPYQLCSCHFSLPTNQLFLFMFTFKIIFLKKIISWGSVRNYIRHPKKPEYRAKEKE